LKLPEEVQHVSSVCAIQDQYIPADIKELISLYEDVFQDPTILPPPWPFDHQIYLVPGAQPMNVRPYRYSPLQKTEIDKRLAKMLHNGIIKPNSSPYASPVLLVRKKDGS
jgi:hypothetical protein